MKVYLIGIIKVTLVALTSTVYGQTPPDFTAEQSFTATGKVISDVSVTKKQDLNLGIAIPGQNNSIDWLTGDGEFGGTTNPIDNGSSTRGVFQIDVTSGVNVEIQIDFPSDLFLDGVIDTTAKMSFRQAFNTPSGRISSSLVDTWSQGEDYNDFTDNDKLSNGDGESDFIQNGNSYTTTVSSPTDGIFYLVMAASVNVGNNQAIGEYSNTITLTATIQN